MVVLLCLAIVIGLIGLGILIIINCKYKFIEQIIQLIRKTKPESSTANDEDTLDELLSANHQMPTEMQIILAPVYNPIAPDPPPEHSHITPVTNQPASEHLDAHRINRDEKAVFQTYAGLTNIGEHLDEGAPVSPVIHEKRELMTRAAVSIAQFFDPRAQRTDASTQASDEEPISQPLASQPSQQEAQYTCYTFQRYPLHQSDTRGLCLILNIVTFADSFAKSSRSDQPAFRQRIGARADVINIAHIFQNKLHYIVQLEENLSKMELLQLITYSLQLNDFHANADAFILFIMSHGAQETILCADGERVEYSELVNLLSEKEGAKMHGKPKLVFIQSCQFDDVQFNTTVPDSLFRWSETNGVSSHTHTGAGPASAPAHPEPPHASSTSPVGRFSNTPAAISAQSHEHDDDERDHNEHPAISGSSHDEQNEDTNYKRLPTHGCDLLFGLSSVSDYSSPVDDEYGSRYRF